MLDGSRDREDRVHSQRRRKTKPDVTLGEGHVLQGRRAAIARRVAAPIDVAPQAGRIIIARFVPSLIEPFEVRLRNRVQLVLGLALGLLNRRRQFVADHIGRIDFDHVNKMIDGIEGFRRYGDPPRGEWRRFLDAEQIRSPRHAVEFLAMIGDQAAKVQRISKGIRRRPIPGFALVCNFVG